MVKGIKMCYIVVGIGIASLLMTGYWVQCLKSEKFLVLEDLAYDRNEKYGYTVYIQEYSNYVPYLVLTKDYNGNVLLLREYLLEEMQIFNPNKRYGGYNEKSYIDHFLNNVFLQVFNQSLQEGIVESPITIASKSSLGTTGTQTQMINRKVFLLSHTELGMPKSPLATIEGVALKYFKDSNSHIARLESGEVCGWWTRSAYTWYDQAVWSISYENKIGDAWVDNPNGIRPAFCLNKDVKITQVEGGEDGKLMYILDELNK